MLEGPHAGFLQDVQRMVVNGRQVGGHGLTGSYTVTKSTQEWRRSLPSALPGAAQEDRRLHPDACLTCNQHRKRRFLPGQRPFLVTLVLQVPLLRTVYRRTAFQEASNNLVGKLKNRGWCGGRRGRGAFEPC